MTVGFLNRSRALMTIASVLVLGATLGACGSSASTPTAPPAASSAPPAATPTPTPAPALKVLAGDRYFGTAIGLPTLDRDAAYAALAADQFNQATAENAMKWQVVEPSRGEFDWSGADETVAFAQEHNQIVRGHTLVWHNQLPDWLTSGSFSADELKTILKDHITTEAGRYKGKIYAWDVVNEAFNDDGTWRESIWYEGLGEEYIADSLRWAHEADPEAKLYLNDYDIEAIGPKSDAWYNLIKSLKAEGVPIDGMGFQGHFDLQYAFPTDLAQNLQRFADLGLEVAITELDVRLEMPATDADLATQADYYRQTVQACLAVKSCVGITVWGFTDKYSWVPFTFPGKGAACLWDAKLAPKPALTAVQEALAAKP
jgi:endo-1,4-beta-xylanase